jgi:hypothetical protein
MRIKVTDFIVGEGDTVNLKKWPTAVDPVYKAKKDYQDILLEHVARLRRSNSCFMPPSALPFY